MKIFLQALLLITLFSCGKVKVSDTEVKAVDKVLTFYGGQVDRLIGFNTGNDSKVNFFELKISESPLLNSDEKWLDEHAGNIAYLFYSNLNNEQSKYNEIRVSIDLTNGASHSYKFSESELKEIEELYPEIEKTNSYIQDADYFSLANQFSGKIAVNETEITDLFEKIKLEYGTIKGIQAQGFSFDNDEGYGDYIGIKEAIMLEEISATIFLVYSRETNELIGLHLP